MNMDGLEWKREKWSLPARAWLLLNEWLGSRLANHLIADHPMIAEHLSRHTDRAKISVIPYGSHVPESVDVRLIERFGLRPQEYYLVIARPEPENSVLQIVDAFSNHPDIPLVVLGRYFPDAIAYHATVLKRAGANVKFVGAVYQRDVVAALRHFAKAYVHGHQVGGTNPSLVESLAAGCPILADDNPFTRWVAGDAGLYFRSVSDLEAILQQVKADPAILAQLAVASRTRHAESFSQEAVLSAYEDLLQRFSREEVSAVPAGVVADKTTESRRSPTSRTRYSHRTDS